MQLGKHAVHGAVHRVVRSGSRGSVVLREVRRHSRRRDRLGGRRKNRQGGAVHVGRSGLRRLGRPGKAAREQMKISEHFSILFGFYSNGFDLNSNDF
jgi:hypothetical protein